MRHLNRHLFLVSLLFITLTVEAVQLGSAKGSAIFGRPLDLTVQVRLEAPAEESLNCFSADVFQADNKFDAGRVRLDVLPAANGVDATIRVRSVTAINEPWAKVILRSTCGTKITKQYDFLTDFAADYPANSALAETSTASTTAPIAAAAATKAPKTTAEAPVSNWSVKRSQAKAETMALKPKNQVGQVARVPQKKIAPEALATLEIKKTTELVAQAVGQPRLKMETFELTDEHQVLLKLSTALVAPSGMRTPEEIQALAQATAVWRALNAMPAVAAPTTTAPAPAVVAQAKVDTIETLPAILPALVNQKLAGKSEFSNLMVYGLISLLTLTLGCIAWLWLRVRKATRAGYGWLNDSLSEAAVADHEPTQFLHTNFHETFAQEEPEHLLNDEPESSTALEAAAAEETEAEAKVEAVVDHELINELAEDQHKATPSIVSEKPVVNVFPDHFDDPRFDERVLRVKKKDRAIAHEAPIVSSVELMDLVLADIPPKLRSVSVPSSEAADKSILTAVTKTAKAKDDSKSNLIDFDFFAEPEPLNKPTRFIR
jgi:hypothetical protein